MGEVPQEIGIDNLLFSDFKQDPYRVTFKVELLGGLKKVVPEGWPQQVVNVLKDMGRWETLARTARDLGFREQRDLPENFGYELYRVDLAPEESQRGLAFGSFKLKPEEALRRTKGEHDLAPPALEEIVFQIQNLQKWKHFRNLIAHVKSVQGWEHRGQPSKQR